MKKLALAVGMLVLIGAAFAGGYFLRPRQETANTPDVSPQKVKPPPQWTEWQYPDSKEQGSGKGGGGFVNGLSVGPVDSVELTTPDDLNKVLTWYAKKFDSEIIAVPTGSGSILKVNSNNKDDPIINGNVLLASYRPSEDRAKGMWRPVQMKVITIRTPRYGLVINISRAEGESHTHIIITYMPNSASE